MVFITAEIGINHNGSLDIAKNLIDIAVTAGCDAVKFQKRTVKKVYSKELLDSPRESPWGKTTREQKNGLEFSLKDYKKIDTYCKSRKIPWFLSSWDIDSQIEMRHFKTKYNKVASAMLVHEKLLKVIAEEKIIKQQAELKRKKTMVVKRFKRKMDNQVTKQKVVVKKISDAKQALARAKLSKNKTEITKQEGLLKVFEKKQTKIVK